VEAGHLLRLKSELFAGFPEPGSGAIKTAIEVKFSRIIFLHLVGDFLAIIEL